MLPGTSHRLGFAAADRSRGGRRFPAFSPPARISRRSGHSSSAALVSAAQAAQTLAIRSRCMAWSAMLASRSCQAGCCSRHPGRAALASSVRSLVATKKPSPLRQRPLAAGHC